MSSRRPWCCSSSSNERRMQPSMPRPSTSTFMNFSASMSSLSHSITCRSAIVAGSIGTRSSSRSCVSTKPPGWVPSCRGKPISSRASCSVRRSRRSPRLRFSSSACSSSHALLGPAPDLAGQRAGHVLGQPQHLADVADGAAGAEAHDGGSRARPGRGRSARRPTGSPPRAARLEVDVDVRRLAPLGRDEALEQQPGPHRVDRGDAEHVADRGVGGRAAPLAQDVLATGRSGRCCSRSGSRGRTRAPRSASARAAAAWPRPAAGHPGSAAGCCRAPRAPAPAAASRPARRPRPDTGSAAPTG